MARKVVFGFLFLIFFQNQAQKKSFFKEKGFIVGFGHGLSSYNLPEGIYRPFFFMGHFGIDLLKKNPLNFNKGTLTLYFEPQINPTFIQYTATNTVSNHLEFGLNVGLKQTIKVYKQWYVFIHGGVGPHYMNIDTRKQYRGFLFSDNFGVGISYLTIKNLAISLGFRLRHLSNANLNFPNSGINTYNYHFGISWIL